VGRDRTNPDTVLIALISTHTPLVGRDRGARCAYYVRMRNFNSHAPCGARHIEAQNGEAICDFNSHAPCGARLKFMRGMVLRVAISTHTPLVGRDALRAFSLCKTHISTHTPLVGRDLFDRFRKSVCGSISTHTPLVGRDQFLCILYIASAISTHTPLVGRDCRCGCADCSGEDFNSHAPCGARRHRTGRLHVPAHFNSHAPCGARPSVSYMAPLAN